MGGGVLFDLSHELDYISFLFGDLRSLTGDVGKKSDVTVDADDYAELSVSTDTVANITVHLDIANHARERAIIIQYRDGKTIIGDLLNGTIRSNGDVVKLSPSDMYEEQINYFFSNIDNPMLMNNLTDAARLFRTIVLFNESVAR